MFEDSPKTCISKQKRRKKNIMNTMSCDHHLRGSPFVIELPSRHFQQRAPKTYHLPSLPPRPLSLKPTPRKHKKPIKKFYHFV